MTEIARVAVTDLNQAEFERRYVRRGVPVVIEALVADSPALGKWTTDFWHREFGDRAFPIMVTDRTWFDNIDEPHLVAMRLAKYIEALSAPDYRQSPVKYYLSNLSLDERFPELRDDIQAIRLYRPQDLQARILFFGRDSEAQCHFHPTSQAILTQVQGEKRVDMFPPSQTRYLYPHSLRHPRYNFSRVSIGAPDAALHPRFREARPQSVVLRPGDGLFIPIHWWHYVRGLDFSTSVTYFFRSNPHEWKLNRPALSSVLRTIYHKLRPSDHSHYSTYRR